MYRNNKHYKNNIEICLGIIPSLKVSNHRNLHTYLTDTLYLEKVFEKDNKIYCECKDNGEDVVLSKEVVENICREYNLNKIREKHKLIPI
jgi:adenosine deaminase